MSSRALRFEDVVVGQSQIIKITLKNSGNSAIILSGHSLNGVGFSMSGIVYPKTLDAGAEIPLSIRFAPSKAGNCRARLNSSLKTGMGQWKSRSRERG